MPSNILTDHSNLLFHKEHDFGNDLNKQKLGKSYFYSAVVMLNQKWSHSHEICHRSEKKGDPSCSEVQL